MLSSDFDESGTLRSGKRLDLEEREGTMMERVRGI